MTSLDNPDVLVPCALFPVELRLGYYDLSVVIVEFSVKVFPYF